MSNKKTAEQLTAQKAWFVGKHAEYSTQAEACLSGGRLCTCEFHLKRLKKRKLGCKDAIARIDTLLAAEAERLKKEKESLAAAEETSSKRSTAAVIDFQSSDAGNFRSIGSLAGEIVSKAAAARVVHKVASHG